MVSYWSLNDCKSPQVSRTLPSILVDLNNDVAWMVSICPLIFRFSSPFTNLLGIVPNAPTMIDITITFIFHSFFFSYLARSRNLSLFLLSFIFTLWSTGLAKCTIQQVLSSFFVDYHKVWSSSQDYYNYFYGLVEICKNEVYCNYFQ